MAKDLKRKSKKRQSRKRRFTRRRQRGGSEKLYDHIYVINMESSTDRYSVIKAAADKQGIELTRFPAVHLDDNLIKVNGGQSLLKQGIPALISEIYKGKKINNKGSIGCYLSHRNIMQKILDDGEGDNNKITVILEDDSILPDDLDSKLEMVCKELPPDWDICYLGKWELLNTIPVTSQIHKLPKIETMTHKNLGYWAYIVKNKSVRERILPYLKIMTDTIDLQMNSHADVINSYLTIPNIVNTDFNNKSTRIPLNDS